MRNFWLNIPRAVSAVRALELSREAKHRLRLMQWYDEHGRHAIYAGGKAVPLPDSEHSLKLIPEHVNRGPQVSEGPQCARDEKMLSNEDLKNRQMMKLYRKEVLKEQAVDLVQIGSPSAKPAKKTEEERELAGVSGD